MNKDCRVCLNRGWGYKECGPHCEHWDEATPPEEEKFVRIVSLFDASGRIDIVCEDVK